MAGADPLNRPRIDRLRLESKVRTLVRHAMYHEYPRRATPKLVEDAVRLVMTQIDAQGGPDR